MFNRRGSGGPSRRDQFAQAWANPPRHTRWQVVRGERLELRDNSGAVLAWAKPDRTVSSLKDPSGRMLVTFKPAVVKQVFSARNILGPQVALLPAGRLNDRFIDRTLSPADVSRIRLRSPLLYLPSPTGADQLSDPSGRVVAHADYGPAGPGRTAGRRSRSRSVRTICRRPGCSPLCWAAVTGTGRPAGNRRRRVSRGASGQQCRAVQAAGERIPLGRRAFMCLWRAGPARHRNLRWRSSGPASRARAGGA